MLGVVTVVAMVLSHGALELSARIERHFVTIDGDVGQIVLRSESFGTPRDPDEAWLRISEFLLMESPPGGQMARLGLTTGGIHGRKVEIQSWSGEASSNDLELEFRNSSDQMNWIVPIGELKRLFWDRRIYRREASNIANPMGPPGIPPPPFPADSDNVIVRVAVNGVELFTGIISCEGVLDPDEVWDRAFSTPLYQVEVGPALNKRCVYRDEQSIEIKCQGRCGTLNAARGGICEFDELRLLKTGNATPKQGWRLSNQHRFLLDNKRVLTRRDCFYIGPFSDKARRRSEWESYVWRVGNWIILFCVFVFVMFIIRAVWVHLLSKATRNE